MSFYAIRNLVSHETLENEWYVKFSLPLLSFHIIIFIILCVSATPTYRVYRLYDIGTRETCYTSR